ncbi:MAG: substrate-binding domain-containing protein [Actinomycetota bacterium]|nr:substrate-binding domain-containing protein [Actinomycetota bacterium]
MRSRILGVGTAIAVLAGMGSAAHADTIRVQSTTDTVDAGLVEGLLRPAYAAAQPGDTLNYVGVGTGAALQNARNGLADVVVTHAPSLEAQFVTDGYSYEDRGRAIFYSDYVIVGPLDDPASVAANHPHDAVGAFEDIASAGAAGHADFLSRANNSGTSVQEQIMWGLTTNPPVRTEPAFDAGSDMSRKEPGDGNPGSTPPAWYHRNPSGQAANLNTTSSCPTATYASGKCYTILDRGTFNRAVNAGTVTNLKIVSEKNAPGARGGEDLLINPFSVYVLNPVKTYPNGITPNVAAATRFVDFLTSPSFQASVDTFPTATDPAFRADAFAKVTLTPPLAPTAAAGSAVTINVNLSNKLSGSPAINGMPVALQRSTDGGASFTDVGPSVNTSTSGNVAFTPIVTTTTRFRLSMPRYMTGTLSPNAFSPNTQDIGVVSVAGATAPDTFAPRVSGYRLTNNPFAVGGRTPTFGSAAAKKRKYKKGTTFRYTLSEAGTVRIAVSQRLAGRRKGKRCVASTRKLRRAKKCARSFGRGTLTRASHQGANSVAFSGRVGSRALSPGSYQATLTASDPARNTSRPKTIFFSVVKR